MCASITIPVHGLGFEVYLAGFRGVGKNPFLLSYSDFRESSPSRMGRPFLGLERGPACMELQRISGALCINPARGGGEREASQGWKGMRPG
jgi:hypothetical protein